MSPRMMVAELIGAVTGSESGQCYSWIMMSGAPGIMRSTMYEISTALVQYSVFGVSSRCLLHAIDIRLTTHGGGLYRQHYVQPQLWE